MAVALNEDVLALLVDVLYYDQQEGRPDHHTLAALCLVNHTIRQIAHRLLYMWIYLPSDRAAQAFLASCARRPTLGRAVHIVQLGVFIEPGYFRRMDAVHPKRFAGVLACCPNARILIARVFTMLPAAVIFDVAATPAARGLRVLHLASYRNNVVHQLLAVFPPVDRLHLDLDHVDTEYRTLPIASERPFREVSVSIQSGTPPYVCAAFMRPVWEPPALPEVFSLRYGFNFWVLSGYPAPSATLRSLGLDVWDIKVAAFATLCPKLVELKLWHPLGVEQDARPLLHTLPETLEHLVYPARGEVYPSAIQGEPYTTRELAALLTTRLSRLRVVSAFDFPESEDNPYGSPHSSAWAEALPRLARGAGLRFRHFGSMDEVINSSITLEYDQFPPRPIRDQLVALPTPAFTDSEDVGLARAGGPKSRFTSFIRLLRDLRSS